MDLLITVAGVALIGVALRDIFQTLFHPTARGAVGQRIARGVWHIAHRLARSSEDGPLYAGPLGYIAVLVSWTAMLVLGWALVFLPQMPDGFTFAQGLKASEHDSLADAIYISLVNITSLGYGDISPASWGLRILGPIETIFGLALVTASISWLLSIYGALNRRETLAHEVHLLRGAEDQFAGSLAGVYPEMLEGMLTSITEKVIAIRRDLIHLPITNYFQSANERSYREELRDFLRRVAAEAREERSPASLRFRAEALSWAIDDLEETLREERSPALTRPRRARS
jgi:Ion channel